MLQSLEIDFISGMQMLFDKKILGFKEVSAGLFIFYFTEIKKYNKISAVDGNTYLY